MFDVNLIFLIAFSAAICYGSVLYYRQIRERARRDVTLSLYRSKVVSICFGTAGVLIWFGCGFLYLHYDGTRPTSPDASSGRIYSLSNHGHVVFLTLTARYYLFLLGTIAISSLLWGYVLDRTIAKSPADSESTTK